MKNLLFPSLLVIFAVLAAAPVVAQTRSTLSPTTLPHIANPGISLTAPATSPLQAQMQDDYATQLKGEQFQLMQQNPSGVTRPELGINRALNGFTPQ
jgi:hypothetical protein